MQNRKRNHSTPAKNSRGTIIFDNQTIFVSRKSIKHMYIRILPPDGKITVSAPLYAHTEDILRLLEKKRSWIHRARQRIITRDYHPQAVYKNGSAHALFGQTFTLSIVTGTGKEKKDNFQDDVLVMTFGKAPSEQHIESRLHTWYRRMLYEKITKLLPIWEHKLGVQIDSWSIRKMRSRWGSCRPSTKKITLNLALIRYPERCLEYILVHELLHIHEPRHNRNFYQMMDRYLPNWRIRDAYLKQHPLTSV